LSNIVLPTEKRKRFCGAGCNMLAYDTNGNEYPCQMFAPVSAGQKALIVKNIKIYDDCIPESETLPECNACIYKNICRTCIGSN
jgi:radical SAM protein with 4Fe4S-binding SPASM domain